MDIFSKPENPSKVRERCSASEYDDAMCVALSSKDEKVREALETSYQNAVSDKKN